MENNQIGTVLWVSEKDGNGIIIDDRTKKELYFDTSVTIGGAEAFGALKRRTKVCFASIPYDWGDAAVQVEKLRTEGVKK